MSRGKLITYGFVITICLAMPAEAGQLDISLSDSQAFSPNHTKQDMQTINIIKKQTMHKVGDQGNISASSVLLNDHINTSINIPIQNLSPNIIPKDKGFQNALPNQIPTKMLFNKIIVFLKTLIHREPPIRIPEPPPYKPII